jgi:serine/threonine/tyrosine protein kinase RAD53
MAQIMEGIKYSHELGVVHRDIKPENILVTADDPPVLKICDFGLSCFLEFVSYINRVIASTTLLIL